MAVWDRFLTEADRAVFTKAGYGHRAGFGTRPALLVIDVNRRFCGGDAPEPIMDSLDRYRNSCGPRAWDAIPRIQEVLYACRAKGVPVFFSTGLTPTVGLFQRGRWADKNPRNVEDLTDPEGERIVSSLTPRADELVIAKDKPSVFFGTPLAAYLINLGTDSLLICGTTTSGCVRATVVDAFSLNYRVTVIEDATFDRGEASHAINLFDMNAKYADVVPAWEVKQFVESLPERSPEERIAGRSGLPLGTPR